MICGDWTRTQLLTGCVEGAVESGLRAAAAV
ncbi:MAG: FAD-dependent oxidoreductase [Deltaproteobacteria bacterium]